MWDHTIKLFLRSLNIQYFSYLVIPLTFGDISEIVRSLEEVMADHRIKSFIHGLYEDIIMELIDKL